LSATPRLGCIRLERVGVRLGRTWALRDVSLELRRGERWLLAGHNGAGKTVLLKLLRGDVWPTPTGVERREYELDGEWHDEPLEARARIAYLGPERQDRYERYGIDARVDDIVATGYTDDTLLLDQPAPAQRRGVRRALERVGLAGLARRRFLSLSHGQRRRVLLARALVGEPDVLLLDEVLNGLDAASRRSFLRALDAASGPGLAWVYATHRPEDRPRRITHSATLAQGGIVVRAVDAAPVGVDSPSIAAAERSRRRTTPLRSAGPPREALIRIDRAVVYRDERRVLGPLDWTLAATEHWHVAGPNGAGKSTLVGLLYGHFSPAVGGRLQRRGLPRGAPIDEWQRRVGLVSPELQCTYAATACTVAEIVASGFQSSIGLAAPPTRAETRRVRAVLANWGLEELGERRARQLSYGQLRRALFARALVLERELLLLDEPWDGLDAANRALVDERLAEAVRRGAQVVVVAHHESDVPPYVTRRLDLVQGQVVPSVVRAGARAPTGGPRGPRGRLKAASP